MTLLQYRASLASACCKVVEGGAGVSLVLLKADIVAATSLRASVALGASAAARDRGTACSRCRRVTGYEYRIQLV